MSQVALFAVGCVVFAVTVAACFISGFMRFDKMAREQAAMPASDAAR